MNKTLLLSLIVISQFVGTSLWFSSNAVLIDIANAHHLDSTNLLTQLTIATQLGFILGSLLYAIFSIADRYKANWVFSLSIVLAALCNAVILWDHLTFLQLFSFRLLTGFFLAGVYPVGMKIAAHFFPKTVSKALGVLVGALVLGTAFPHFIASFNINLPWTTVIIASSSLAFMGGIIMLFLDTPVKNNIQKFNISIIPNLFKIKGFKNASLGYFGHMWELYTFWTFVPMLILTFSNTKEVDLNISFVSFIVIAIGTIGCFIAGKLAQIKSSLQVSKWALSISLACCLLSPFSFYFPTSLFIIYLCVWGLTVVADSPLLSTIINKNAPQGYNGTALTISTSIGFFTTVISIALFNYLLDFTTIPFVFIVLVIGPILSLFSLRKMD